uniref:Uncharacterized protein n=1 Tax=Tanacetum cinerariifolium TaxID=118510 RepID=A0A699HC64_TANCI|nr:hypothetical protein [Tanacetum cinerariifolium]
MHPFVVFQSTPNAPLLLVTAGGGVEMVTGWLSHDGKGDTAAAWQQGSGEDEGGGGGCVVGTQGRGVAARVIVDLVDRLIKNVFGFGRKARRKSFTAAVAGGARGRAYAIDDGIWYSVISSRKNQLHLFKRGLKILLSGKA